MKKIHIVHEQKPSAYTFCGLRAIWTSPLNVKTNFVEAVKESHLCKNCLARFSKEASK